MERKVSFPSHDDLKVVGNLYVPAEYHSGQRRPGIVVGHPIGGVKEQTAGLYSRLLAERGFITLTFDSTYQGESEGLPRFLEDPASRVEDIKCAVSYMSALPEVDPDRIGGLGICAAGGYVPFAAQTDRRIKAVGTVSAVCAGSMFRDGLGGNQTREQLMGLLEACSNDRTEQAKGNPPRLQRIVPETAEEITPETGQGYREAHEYYRTKRAQHPNSQNWIVLSSFDKIVPYDSYDRIGLLAPHPLLMIAGTDADTRYFSERGIKKAHEPKELFLIEGATHVALYDKMEFVGAAIDKLDAFYKEHLGPVA
jgi:fermentation-respiration switch protein FrsA (DUF1100 family)